MSGNQLFISHSSKDDEFVSELRDLLADWRVTTEGVERRFSIFVDDRASEGSTDDQQAATNEAASALLALPWNLMHDGRLSLSTARATVGQVSAVSRTPSHPQR